MIGHLEIGIGYWKLERLPLRHMRHGGGLQKSRGSFLTMKSDFSRIPPSLSRSGFDCERI